MLLVSMYSSVVDINISQKTIIGSHTVVNQTDCQPLNVSVYVSLYDFKIIWGGLCPSVGQKRYEAPFLAVTYQNQRHLGISQEKSKIPHFL